MVLQMSLFLQFGFRVAVSALICGLTELDQNPDFDVYSLCACMLPSVISFRFLIS